MTSDDMSLVREYARNNSEEAFATLVSRHIDLVYSVALRQVRDAHLAEEISQAVFIVLARKAKSLGPSTILSGWLCRTARNVSADTLKIQRRRQSREQESYMQQLSNEPDSSVWRQIEPLLEEALDCLGEKEHNAIVLRFLDGKELKQVGAAMGTGEDAARMRINRGLEKMRKFFVKRGVTLSGTAIAGAVAANSVQAAPAGLAAAIITAKLSGTVVTTTAAVAATKAIVMTTLQKTVVAAIIVALSTAVIYEARQESLARAEALALRHQQTPMAEQINQLTRDRDETARQLAALRVENEKLNRNTAELLKLRGEVGALRNAAQDAKSEEADSILIEAKSMLAKVNILKKWIEQRPEEQIPEFQYLLDYDWIDAVKTSNMLGDNAPKNAMWHLRESAKRQFAHEAGNALRRFVEDHNGELPNELAQLNPYFQKPMNDAMLKSYKLLHTGKLSDLPKNEWLIGEIAPPFDGDDDMRMLIGIKDSRKVRREK